jgi:hypothetical protein
MALDAAVVGSDHFVGAVSVPHELFVRQITDFCLVGC